MGTDGQIGTRWTVVGNMGTDGQVDTPTYEDMRLARQMVKHSAQAI